MHFQVLTLFPDMVMHGLGTSIIGRAIEEGIISLEATNIRDYTNSKHGKTDDYPYGGGAGMVMQAQPVYDAFMAVTKDLPYKPRVIYLTPQGRVFDQQAARELAIEKGIVFLCGHYEGIDERVIEEIVTDEFSIGDFVVTGGEMPPREILSVTGSSSTHSTQGLRCGTVNVFRPYSFRAITRRSTHGAESSPSCARQTGDRISLRRPT